MNIRTVTVVGANGTMGCNVSGIFASFGDAKVYMVSRDIDKSKKAVTRAVASVRAGSIARNLIPADYSILEDCVRASDLVFECTAENLAVKLDVTKRIAAALPVHTVACSGTSGLSVTRLAECFPEDLRANYMGVHMFNPPYSMSLCEIIPTKYTSRPVFEETKEYLAKKLFRTVVEVKDSPAFLGNRIGFQFINEAMQYANQFKDNGGIDYIDAILAPYTGRAMAPLTTSDFVGLDVHQAIVDNLYQNTFDYAHETFSLPEFAKELIEKGALGRKTRGGLYKTESHENRVKRVLVYDVASHSYRDKNRYVFPYAEKMVSELRVGNYQSALSALICNHSIEAQICLEFMLKYIVYSLTATEAVGYDIHAADDVMAAGFNWCPPLAMIEALATVTDFRVLLMDRLDKSTLGAVDVDHLLARIEPSKYDYRLFFKSVK